MIEHYDYTMMRLGKRVTTGIGGKIERCPVCGRKGLVSENRRVASHSRTDEVTPFFGIGTHTKSLAQDWCGLEDNSRHVWDKR
jgi:hypothetical protein